MTAAKSRVALVAPAGSARASLATYLGNAGFDVQECDELAVPASFVALVALTSDEAAHELVLRDVRTWLKIARLQRIIVVTPNPMAYKALLAVHGERLYVLAAPAFGWDLVDALRAQAPTRPRGA